MRENGGFGAAVHFARCAYPGQHACRDAEEVEQFLVPLERLYIIQHGAGGVGHVRHMHLSPGEVPYQPAVHGSEPEFAVTGPFKRPGHVLEDPADLCRREIRVEDEACLFADLSHHGRIYALAIVGGAPVLPDDGVVDRVARGGVPHDGGLPLVGDPYGGDVLAVYIHLGDGLGHYRSLGRPYIHGVVFHPPRTGEMLGEFLLRHAADVPGVVEDYGTGGTGTLVEGEYVFVHQ